VSYQDDKQFGKFRIILTFLTAVMQYRDGVYSTVEKNSSVFYLIQMHWLLPARACRQYNFAPTKCSSSGGAG